jgi:hypothetical protein
MSKEMGEDNAISDSSKAPLSMLMKMVSGAVTRTKAIQLEDPLIFDTPTGKSTMLAKAIESVEAKNHVFYPAVTTYPKRLQGHA